MTKRPRNPFPASPQPNDPDLVTKFRATQRPSDQDPATKPPPNPVAASSQPSDQDPAISCASQPQDPDLPPRPRSATVKLTEFRSLPPLFEDTPKDAHELTIATIDYHHLLRSIQY